MAILPAAPGLFSTYTCCPRIFDISAATERPTISELPPGANGTTNRIGFTGYVCACAANTNASATMAAAAIRFISSSLKLISPKAAVDRDHRPGDVVGARRGEERNEIGDVLGLAVLAHRNLVLALPLPVLGCVVAKDLLAHDAPGRDRIHRDAVLAHFTRKALRPGMHRSFGAECAVDPVGLAFSRDIDDAAPAARDHLREQCVCQLPLPREVERKRLVPLLLGRIQDELAAPARIVAEGVERDEGSESRGRDRRRRVFAHQVAFDDR